VEAIGLGVRVGQFGIDLWLSKALTGHLEITNQIVVFVCPSRNLNDLAEVGGVLSLNIRVYDELLGLVAYKQVRLIHTNGIFNTETVQLSLGQSTPNLRLVDLVRILHTTIEGDHMLDQDINSLGMLLVLLVDHECFLKQSMLGSDLRDLCGIVVLQLVDVSDNLSLVRTDSGKEHEVLEIAVVAEGRGLDDDLLEQFDKLQRKVGFEEGMDGDGNIVRVSTLWQDGGNNLQDASQSTPGQCVGDEQVSPDRSGHDGGCCLVEGPEPKDPPHAS